MRYKSLCLLSFSLAFLAKGMAYDYSYEPYEDQYEIAEDGDDEYLPEEQYQSQKVSYSESNSSEECLSHFRRVHIGVRHNEARGIGYKDGYTTLEAFGIYDGYSKYFMPFIDLRGHVFNNGKLAGNAGIGERTLIPSINHTFGSFLYYDVRRVGKGLTVNQLSPGLELVGKRVEFHINGYFPVGKDKSRQYRYEFDRFKGNNIILKSKQYQAMRGGDAEIGVHLTQSTKYDLYASVGPYYLHSSQASSWGGRTRLLGRFKEYFSLEAAYSYDHLFRSVIEGNVAFTLPLGCKLKRTGNGCPQGNDLLLSRASFAPSRFEIPVVKRVHPKDRAINPATGKPWVVWFVNNTSSSAGTIKSPFPTLLQAQNASSPNDMIYVFPGDGTTNGMNMGITLQDGQSFFGSGISQKISTTKGKIQIHNFSNSSPLITASTGNVVNLGNGNEVSGFNILATSGASGIGTALSLLNGAIIQNNSITVTGGQLGILLQYATGNIDISRNQILGNPTGNTGIFFTLTNTQQAKISENMISGFANAINLVNTIGSLPYSLQIAKNEISNYTGSGILLINLTNATVTISENLMTSNNNTNPSILVDRVLSSVIENNSITSINSGIQFSTNTSNGTQYTTDIFKNLVNSIGSDPAIALQTTGSDSLCGSLVNNRVTTNAPSTIGLSITATGTGNINIDNFEVNIIPKIATSGNVNLVATGSCGN